jgi:hypothetical protein
MMRIDEMMNSLPKSIIIQDSQRGSCEANTAIQVALKHDLNYQFTDKLLKEDHSLVMGSVEYLRSWFDEFDIAEPMISDYPRRLKPFLRRKVKRTFISQVDPRCHFIKPVQVKLFEPHNIPDDLDPYTPVYVSEWREWEAEFRVYVMNGRIVGISQYKGENDIDIGCDPYLIQIENMVTAFKKAPAAAYTLDVGLFKDDQLDLVEFNDAWATGRYPDGITPVDYIKWLWVRWNEIIKVQKKEPIRHWQTIEELTRTAYI